MQTRHHNKALILSVSLVLSCSISGAFGASCSGVDMRVNDKTRDVQNRVIEKMQDVENTIINEAVNQTAQIISAIRVVNTSGNNGADQNITMTRSASEASASAWVAHRTNAMTLDATQRYRSIGYNACGSIAAAKSFAQSNASNTQAAFNHQDNIVANTTYEEWYKNATKNTVSAADILNGNMDSASRYIALVLGPSPKKNKSLANSTSEKIGEIAENRMTALKSLASFVLTNTAAYKETDKKLDAFMTSWMGRDGGERWASSMAASHERGILLDQVRIEAANIAAKAYGLKKKLNTELALAGYSLARTDKIISSNAATITDVDGNTSLTGSNPIVGEPYQ